MVIDPTLPSPGSMTVQNLDLNGGKFDTEFLIQPNFVLSEDLDFTPGDVDFMGAPVIEVQKKVSAMLGIVLPSENGCSD